MRKMKPVVLGNDAMKELSEQVREQTIDKKVPKSTDPVNYPVFEIPLCRKVLIYVPNHTYQDSEGKDRLRMDEPLLHLATKGNRFLSFRCIQSLISKEAGYTGECPFCEVVPLGWDLANEIIEQKCAAQGLNSEDTNNKDVKSIRSTAYGDRAVKDAERTYTFPIVVFETDEACKKILQDEEGKIKYTVMWYSISERQYNKTWAKTLEGMEEEPTHPGGRFFLLNYEYDTKGKQPNIRDSASNLSVTPRNKANMDGLKTQLDALTEGWTPEKARETVIKNQFFAYNDLEDTAEELIEPTRNLLEFYRAKKNAGMAGGAADVDGGFRLEKKEDAAPVGVAVGDTDLDME